MDTYSFVLRWPVVIFINKRYKKEQTESAYFFQDDISTEGPSLMAKHKAMYGPILLSLCQVWYSRFVWLLAVYSIYPQHYLYKCLHKWMPMYCNNAFLSACQDVIIHVINVLLQAFFSLAVRWNRMVKCDLTKKSPT